MNPPLHSTISVRFVNDFLEQISVDTTTREQFIRLAGIAPLLLESPSTRLTEEQVTTLYRLLATHLDDEMPGFFSRPLRLGTMKFLCLSLLDAPSLQTALHRYTRFYRILLDDFSYKLEREPDVTRLAIVPGVNPGSRPSPLGQQLMLKIVHSLASWLVGKTLPLLRLHFAFPPPRDIAEYEYLYAGPVFFNQPESALYFSSSLMDMPLIHRTPEDLRAFIKKAPAGWIFASLSKPSMGRQIREYLENNFHEANSMEGIAQALHLSARTLCRRLESEGTSFRTIKDELRRDIAIQRLTRTSQSIAAIAFELGFVDTTTFHRAFKQWTGNTPGTYRQTRSQTKTSNTMKETEED